MSRMNGTSCWPPRLIMPESLGRHARGAEAVGEALPRCASAMSPCQADSPGKPLREVVVVDGERRALPRGHVREDPVAAALADGPAQKCVRGDETARQVIVADVVAFEVEPGLVAVNVDLGLEGG